MYICNESGAGVTVRTPYWGALRVRGIRSRARGTWPPPLPLSPPPAPGLSVGTRTVPITRRDLGSGWVGLLGVTLLTEQ